jgi:hypothetical protein
VKVGQEIKVQCLGVGKTYLGGGEIGDSLWYLSLGQCSTAVTGVDEDNNIILRDNSSLWRPQYLPNAELSTFV